MCIRDRYWTNEAQPRDLKAEDWFNGAKQNPGSWWIDWQRWITALDDTKVAARDPLNGKYQPIEDAPGSFASVRLDALPHKE